MKRSCFVEYFNTGLAVGTTALALQQMRAADMNHVVKGAELSIVTSEEAQLHKAYRTVRASMRSLGAGVCDARETLTYTAGPGDDMSIEASVGSTMFGVRRNGQTLVSWDFIEPLMNGMFIDAVTGIGDRRAFKTHCELLCDEINNGWRGLFAFVDVDHFKSINDSYGHYVGDIALARVAARCSSILDKKGFAARLGGDEFALSRECDSVAQAQGLMDELLASVELVNADECFSLVDVSISAGCIFIPAGSRNVTVDELFIAADTALYSAKRKGRACAVVAELRSFIPTDTPFTTDECVAGCPLTSRGTL